MEISEKIKGIVQDSLSRQGIDSGNIEIVVETPNEKENGEYSTNIAMRLASQLKKSPMDIAKDIVEGMEEDIDIEKVDIAQPGFINFFLSNRYFLTQVSKIVNEETSFLSLDTKEGKKVVIEYTDANPFKELHIGHLYSNAVGESFARLQEALGADVKRACYQGDIGLHVAKTMWGLEKKLTQENQTFADVEKLSLEERVKYLGEAYVLGATGYDESEDSEIQNEIQEINQYLFLLVTKQDLKSPNKELEERYRKGRQWCLDFFEKIYEKVGTKFDHYFFESEVAQKGLSVVMENVGKIFEEDDGAVIYRGDEKKNLHTRVFVNKYGVPTYEAKEIGLALEKSKTMGFDESVVVTADEQSGYFKVVLDALGKIDEDLASKIKHFSHGKVGIPGSTKMSSRKGGILSGEWLIDETQRLVKAKMMENERVDRATLEYVSEKVAIGAIKYAFLKVGVGRNIVFDFDQSISFDGDTGPYLMYVYSRCSSILADAKIKESHTLCFDSCLANPYTRDLVSTISKYRRSLLGSAESYSPSILAQYLFDLGQTFNAFYQNVKVLDAPEEERQVLLLVVKATMKVMQDGLSKLGIDVVERM